MDYGLEVTLRIIGEVQSSATVRDWWRRDVTIILCCIIIARPTRLLPAHDATNRLDNAQPPVFRTFNGMMQIVLQSCMIRVVV